MNKTFDGRAALARYDAMLDAMVDRFLSWKLPKDFGPDAGISFTPTKPDSYDTHWWPIGTNLLTAEQARQMFKECLPPACFGLDDCSAQSLSACSWVDKCSKA